MHDFSSENTGPVGVRVSSSVVLPSRIQRDKSIFTDYGSLVGVSQSWETVPSTFQFEVDHANAQSFASGIESLILYESVFCDSLFMEDDPDLLSLAEKSSGFFSGVYLDESSTDITRLSPRETTARRVEEVLARLGDTRPNWVSPTNWQRAEFEDHAYDKPKLDIATEFRKPLLLPAALDPLVRMELSSNAAEVSRHLPQYAMRSGRTLSRTLFYAELARDLCLPYSPGRNRAQLFHPENLPDKGISQSILSTSIEKRRNHKGNHAEANLGWSKSTSLYSSAFKVPTLAEHVLKFCVRKRCTLGEGILEVRSSKTAVDFRKYMERLTNLMINALDNEREANRILTDITTLTDKWASDLEEGVRYRTRTLTAKNIPIIGGILESADFHEITIPDPILKHSKATRGLLFVNEVMRA